MAKSLDTRLAVIEAQQAEESAAEIRAKLAAMSDSELLDCLLLERPEWVELHAIYGHPRDWPGNEARWKGDDTDRDVAHDLYREWRGLPPLERQRVPRSQLERYMIAFPEWEPDNSDDRLLTFLRDVCQAGGGCPHWPENLERYGHPRRWPENAGRWSDEDDNLLIRDDLYRDYRPNMTDKREWHLERIRLFRERDERSPRGIA